jgi:ribonuclease HI
MKKEEKESKGVPNARKPFTKPFTYANQDLMKEFNEMMIRIKRHLFGIPGDTIKPENEELDRLTNKIMEALKKETEPTINYYD